MLINLECRKSNVQEYECQVFVSKKWAVKPNENHYVSFDKCLTHELFQLWDQGIITTGSCCGQHLNSPDDSSFIGVLPEFIPKMKELGYKVRHNNCRPDDEDSFIPKSIINEVHYNIDKFKHYKWVDGMPKGIGCCCECVYHKPVYGHPWHNGKSILTEVAYICTYGFSDEKDDHYILSSKHTIGCENWEGRESS